ncbi:MAG TPA: RsmE family RNA methyltransferase [Candidatus Omnitrophota bacterium]|nr:RsmE family RNA methyltransferase [Candidatus Omnitrophota bacterium]
MHRFFCPHSDLEQEIISITDRKEIHHLQNVLRLKSRQQIRLFDGSHKEIVGTIVTMNSHKVEIRRDYVLPKTQERGIDVVLACAIPKRAKFEFIIEKATELGVDEIIPLKTERTEIALKSERLEKKLDRYRTVAINAAKQSGRVQVPRILPITTTSEIFQDTNQQTLKFIAALSDQRQNLFESFQKIDLKNYKRMIFFIGPEGDFTSGEIALALEAGCIPISLGSNVLKVDTAAICVISFASLFLDYVLKQ